LEWAKVSDSNLEMIWKGVREERRTPELHRARKLEALLGRDPDESDPQTISQLIADAERLSVAAIEELAAEHGQTGKILTSDELSEIADHNGFDVSPADTVRLSAVMGLPRIGEVAAWRLGARAARALREQEGLQDNPISDQQLAHMAGVQSAVLSDRRSASGISFALDKNFQSGRVVLRSKWHDGRRFELARLLGDRIAGPRGGRLFPATRAYTYRQKVQRSFAAEFLSPFEAVDERLGDDYSVENQKDIADHFQVSELTIRTLLVNHGRLEREDLDGEFEVGAA
jgi:hypothetical protein